MFTYLRPGTVKEAVELLGTLDGARIFAGGTDLMVGLRDGMTCKYIIDIKGIPELNALEMTDTGLAVGGAVPLNRIIGSENLAGSYSVLKDAGMTLANHILRNRATLVGNLCNASPGGDMIGASLVLGGYIEAASVGGERKIPLDGFFTGVKEHTLLKNELAVRVVFPPQEGKGIYLKKRRIRGHDLAQVGITAFRHESGAMDLALGAVAPVPVLLKSVVEAGEEPRPEKVIEAALSSISPISDVRSSREYPDAIVKRYIRQAIEILYGGGAS